MIPDPEAVAVEWAKADAALDALLDGRVATRLPRGWASPFLRVVVLEGEGVAAETADPRVALMQWDAYAYTGFQPSPDYAAASQVIRVLMEQMAAVADIEVADAVLLDFARISGMRRIDEQTGWARFGVDALMALRAKEE